MYKSLPLFSGDSEDVCTSFYHSVFPLYISLISLYAAFEFLECMNVRSCFEDRVVCL